VNKQSPHTLETLADDLDHLDAAAAFLDDSTAKTNLATRQLVLQVADLRNAIRQVRIHGEQLQGTYFTDDTPHG